MTIETRIDWSSKHRSFSAGRTGKIGHIDQRVVLAQYCWPNAFDRTPHAATAAKGQAKETIEDGVPLFWVELLGQLHRRQAREANENKRSTSFELCRFVSAWYEYSHNCRTKELVTLPVIAADRRQARTVLAPRRAQPQLNRRAAAAEAAASSLPFNYPSAVAACAKLSDRIDQSRMSKDIVVVGSYGRKEVLGISPGNGESLHAHRPAVITGAHATGLRPA